MECLVQSSLESCIESIERRKDGSEEDISFQVIDLGEIYRQYKRWEYHLKRVQPYYAVKCNRDPVILSFLASLGVGFNCSSKLDVQRSLNLDHDVARIIFTHPYKTRTFLQYAAHQGVNKMTVDSPDELWVGWEPAHETKTTIA